MTGIYADFSTLATGGEEAKTESIVSFLAVAYFILDCTSSEGGQEDNAQFVSKVSTYFAKQVSTKLG